MILYGENMEQKIKDYIVDLEETIREIKKELRYDVECIDVTIASMMKVQVETYTGVVRDLKKMLK